MKMEKLDKKNDYVANLHNPGLRGVVSGAIG
jgi:hypothetical protein